MGDHRDLGNPGLGVGTMDKCTKEPKGLNSNQVWRLNPLPNSIVKFDVFLDKMGNAALMVRAG